MISLPTFSLRFDEVHLSINSFLLLREKLTMFNLPLSKLGDLPCYVLSCSLIF